MGLAATAIVVAGLRAAEPVLAPIAFSLFLALLSHPLFQGLRRRGVPTGIAVLVTMTALGIVLSGFALLLLGSLGEFREVGPHFTISRMLAGLKISMAGLPVNANEKYPSDLSGGMRKRAGLARALALDPEIVFLDEPTAGLDPIGADAFDRLILALRDALNLSVFLVTHDLDTLHTCCDRIAVLAEKRVLATGTLAEMLQVEHPWVHEYFTGPRARAAMTSDSGGAL